MSSNERTWGDRISFFVGVGAIVVTLGVGTCSTNARFDDVNRRFDDVNTRIDDVNTRIDDVNRRFDDVQADIRELRALLIDVVERRETAD